jgi:hypothetical protein
MFSIELAGTDHASFRVDVVPEVEGPVSHAQTLRLRHSRPISPMYILFEILLEVSDIISIKLKSIRIIAV